MSIKNKKYYKLLFILFIPVFLGSYSKILKGQSMANINQLLNQIDTVSSKNKKIDLYNQLSAKYIKRNTDTFFIYYTKAVNLSQKADYTKGLAEAYINRADLCFYLDSFQLALIFNDLSNTLYGSLNDTAKLAQLSASRGKFYYYMRNYDSAILYYKNTIKLAEAIGNKSLIARSLKHVGKINWLQGDLSESLNNYQQSLKIAKEINDKRLECLLYNNIGTVYYAVGDYTEALKYYYIALPLRDTIKDYKGKSTTLVNIGLVYSGIGKHEEAFNHYKKAALLSDSLNYKYGKAYALYNIGTHLLNRKKTDSAIIYFKRAINIYKENNNNLGGMCISYAKLGKAFQKKHKADSALKYFRYSISAAQQMKSNSYEASASSSLAYQFFTLNKLDSALKYANKVNAYIKKAKGYKKMKLDNYKLLSDIYKKKRNYKKALDYLTTSVKYKDSIFDTEKTKEITRMEVLYKTEQKNKENEYLKKEQERQKVISEADRLTIRLQTYLVAVVLILLFTVIGFAFVFYKEKQKLKEANNTINKLFSIISHDLRGPLGNFKALIDLLLLDFANNDRDKINSLLKMMQKTAGLNYDLLENLLSWSRTESGKLEFNPENIKLYSLIESIFEHFDYSTTTKSIQLKNKVDPKTCIYADEYMINTILRNLISNAIKFTKTNGEIRISNKIIDKLVEITVEDTGVGMPHEIAQNIFSSKKFITTIGTAKEKGTGLGLKLCQDFVNRHNGTIKVESQVNKGTKISFTISKCSD